MNEATANLTYVLLILMTIVYAFILEHFRNDPDRNYAPKWTWLTVVIGCSVVLGVFALHLLLYIPDDVPKEVAWWTGRTVFYHFVAGGLPIIVWQVVVDRRDIERALRASMARRKG
jgi:hypothetical protein